MTLLTTGGQMTENLVALVPGAQILFAGAMCSFGAAPLCWQGRPARWADELDRLVELAPIVVPGHGPIGGDEEVRDLQAYLRACVAAGGDPARRSGRGTPGPTASTTGQRRAGGRCWPRATTGAAVDAAAGRAGLRGSGCGSRSTASTRAGTAGTG